VAPRTLGCVIRAEVGVVWDLVIIVGVVAAFALTEAMAALFDRL
jgi:hypothetical protein